MAVDTLGHLLAAQVTPAKVSDREQVAELAQKVQAATGEQAKVVFVDQGYTGADPSEAAANEGIQLEVVKRPEGQSGFVLLPKRWVVERSHGWMPRIRRLVRDYKRLPRNPCGSALYCCHCTYANSALPHCPYVHKRHGHRLAGGTR